MPDEAAPCHFRADAGAVRAARAFVREALEGQIVEEMDMDAVLLLVSELATNAVLHTQTEFDVVVDVLADGVRVEVTDVGDGCPSPVHPLPDGEHGRGLTLVAGLATRWGVVLRGESKSVWFGLRCPTTAGDRRRRGRMPWRRGVPTD
ncbi:MAG: ATP-binding protein [Acidimicrobiia bacterium]|nr:ATP-binding protein [Acidimicrobiia bacterium]